MAITSSGMTVNSTWPMADISANSGSCRMRCSPAPSMTMLKITDPWRFSAGMLPSLSIERKL